MRKWMIAIIAVLFTITMSACQQTATPTGETSDQSDLTAEEVYNEALAVAEDMESAEVLFNMKQTIEAPDEDAMSTEGEFVIQMTVDPISMHQEGSLTLDMADFPAEDVHMEMYITEDGMYLYESDFDQWIMMDSNMAEFIDMMGAQQQDPVEELKMIEDYLDDLTFEQSDDSFIFKLDFDGEKFSELVEEILDEAFPPEMMEMVEDDDLMEQLDIHHLSYEMTFDKDSYQMMTYDIDMSMTVNVEGYEVTVNQLINTEYKNMNNIDVIEVPQEIIDSAIDQSF